MTEPCKTPRTDAAVDKHSFLDGSRELHPDIIPFIQALEIETQELALELAEYVNTDKQRVYHRSGIGTETAEGIRYARATELIASHRAKQEAAR